MPREMFGDIVDPSIKFKSRRPYTVLLTIAGLYRGVFRAGRRALGGDEYPADAAIGDGVRGGAAAPATAATTPAAAQRRSAPPPPPMAAQISPAAAPVEAPKMIAPEPPPRMPAVVGGIRRLPTAPAVSIAPPPPPGARARRRRHQGAQADQRQAAASIRPWRAPPRCRGRSSSKPRSTRTATSRAPRCCRSIPLLDNAALDAVNAVEVFTHGFQWPAGRSDHDRHGKFPSPVRMRKQRQA